MAYYGGVEGGGTNTIAIVLDKDGKILSRVDGPGTNGWLLGPAKVADILIGMFHEAKEKAGLAKDLPLESIGLCMSGFLQPSQQEGLKAAFAEKDPALAKSYYVDNDSPGSIYTAAGPKGGMVLISGTGSMGQVINGKTGKATNCGGWGHLFGDESSAYSIASGAVRRIFRGLDSYTGTTFDGKSIKAKDDISVADALMLSHFAIENKEGMLDLFYKSFEKGKIASFTKTLADAALGKESVLAVISSSPVVPKESVEAFKANGGDVFARKQFRKAGLQLGSMARTLAPNLDKPEDGAPIRIVCVGSVWKSWELLKDGFIAGYSGSPDATSAMPLFELVRLKETSAVGAAWKGAQMAPAGEAKLNVDFDSLVELLYRHHH